MDSSYSAAFELWGVNAAYVDFTRASVDYYVVISTIYIYIRLAATLNQALLDDALGASTTTTLKRVLALNKEGSGFTSLQAKNNFSSLKLGE